MRIKTPCALRAALAAVVFLAAALPAAMADDAEATAASRPLLLVVMDPLAAPLSCPCVEGYAQREYEALAEYLTRSLGRPVKVEFVDALAKAEEAGAAADIIIGKDSVVRGDCTKAGRTSTPLAALTDRDGDTTQTGLIVVGKHDPAEQATDLAGYRILFGPADCQEKYAAPIAVLREAGVTVPDQVETSAACSDGACKVIELGPDARAAAVISSYAAPLLEGCGTIKKGDLRVIAETKPVPFITAFATERLSKQQQADVRDALLEVGQHPELCQAIESLLGFVEVEEPKADQTAPAPRQVSKKKLTPRGWNQWRGPDRNGRAELPRVLPPRPRIVWETPLPAAGLGGIAATAEIVVLGDRNAEDTHDVFAAYAAADGQLLWSHSTPRAGNLDYGNTPRATPLIDQDVVYTLGAFGDLACLDLETGIVLWEQNIRRVFNVEAELMWGTSSSPLLIDGEKLIVNPGGAAASVAALDATTGEMVWQTPGDSHAYASFCLATLGGRRQIVGYDKHSLGGWDPHTGRRLWRHVPEVRGDFNVPTPLVVGPRLFVATENNAARLYAFSSDGTIRSEPVARQDELAPDMSSPVHAAGRLFCANGSLYCLDANTLEVVWTGDDSAVADYNALIADDERVLVVGRGGTLLLVDARADHFEVVSRLDVLGPPSSVQLYSHPALVGTRLYLRGEQRLVCFELGDAATSEP